jgi:hypothetical protein
MSTAAPRLVRGRRVSGDELEVEVLFALRYYVVMEIGEWPHTGGDAEVVGVHRFPPGMRKVQTHGQRLRKVRLTPTVRAAS